MLRWIAGALAAALLSLILIVPPPPTDNSVDSLLLGRNEAVKAFERFRREYGDEDLLVVQLAGGSPAERARQILKLDQILQASPAVTQVFSAGNLYRSALEVLVDPEMDDEAAMEVLDRPLSRSLGLFTPETALALARIRPGQSTARTELMELLQVQEGSVQRRVAGSARLNFALDAQGERIERQVLPLVGILAVLILFITLRNFALVVATLVPAGLAVLGADRFLALSGGTTNILVGVSRPLTFVILLASSIHLVLAWQKLRQEGDSGPVAARRAASSKAKAIWLALGTTAVGFGSLVPSSVGPIRAFGWVSALGLLLGLPLVLGLLPSLLSVCPAGPRRPAGWQGALARGLVQGAIRRPIWPVTVGLSALLLGVVASFQLTVDSHAIRYFPEDSSIRSDHTAIEDSGVGLQALELVLRQDRPWLAEADLRSQLEALAQAIAQRPGVQNRLDPLLLLREASVRMGGPDAPVDPSLVQLRSDFPKPLENWRDPEGGSLRMSFLIETLDAQELDRLETQVGEAVAKHMPQARDSMVLTGSYRLIVETQRALLETVWLSLGITALVMQAVVTWALGSFRMGLVAALPNLLPVAANFGVMALLGLPLDLGTSMVAALALGIAVDDTLHFSFAARQRGLRSAADTEGRAILVSSLTIGLGFLSLAATDFRPTMAFGVLSASAMAFALVGDLWVLPALLAKFRLAHRETPS